jgi:hypothetical protein
VIVVLNSLRLLFTPRGTPLQAVQATGSPAPQAAQ